MIDPASEQALLDVIALGLETELRRSYRALIERIRAGESPRDATRAEIEQMSGPYADLMARGLSALMGLAIGTQAVMAMRVGDITLSERLYAEADEVSRVVQGIVSRHAAGWQDARKLTLQLFEGYGYRPELDEPLKLHPANHRLPKYMRSELLTDPGVRGQLERHLAQVQAAALRTPGLRAAYMEVLDAMERGAGQQLLERKLRVAYYERMRYFGNRIAQTELHRVYAQRQAAELMQDDDVQFVQWRLSVTHPRIDICDYFAGVDAYGLGPGVYPVDRAPVAPAHPFCRCVLAPRLDIPRGTRARLRKDADQQLLEAYDEHDGARIMGSAERRARVLAGERAIDVWNERSPPEYRVKTVAEAAAEYQARLDD